MESKYSRFEISKKEAFEFGRLEGLKEAYGEILELGNCEGEFFLKYAEARLKSINSNVLMFEKFKQGIK